MDGWVDGWRDCVMGLSDFYGKLKGRGDEWEYDGTIVRVCDGAKGREAGNELNLVFLELSLVAKNTIADFMVRGSPSLDDLFISFFTIAGLGL